MDNFDVLGCDEKLEDFDAFGCHQYFDRFITTTNIKNKRIDFLSHDYKHKKIDLHVLLTLIAIIIKINQSVERFIGIFVRIT